MTFKFRIREETLELNDHCTATATSYIYLYLYWD
jgi:hypothetical protein